MKGGELEEKGGGEKKAKASAAASIGAGGNPQTVAVAVRSSPTQAINRQLSVAS